MGYKEMGIEVPFSFKNLVEKKSVILYGFDFGEERLETMLKLFENFQILSFYVILMIPLLLYWKFVEFVNYMFSSNGKALTQELLIRVRT